MAPGPVAAGASTDVEMEEQPPGSPELVAPAPQLVEQPPDSLEMHRRKAGAPPARVAVKKGRGLGKGSAHRRRYTTAEKRKILQRAREIQQDKMCTMEEAAVELGVPKGNLSKWGKLKCSSSVESQT